ncbi:LLM class flavin-dependent oxidoreductase [Agromyces sp. SYSU T00194]|uniref:LLM class flavin-dependent oxidoreductase n=1 Tax=Agromyces chitinivorans TaxID=3158560 RepID=UPI003397AB90
MEIGLGVFSGEALPDTGLDQSEELELSLREMEHAERVGLDAVWITEHHFLESGYVGSVLPYAAALAARTTRIGVGISVALAPLYEPIRLAEDAAFVDQLSNGRLRLGLALGYRDVEYEGFGVRRPTRVRRTEELCEILRQAWSPGPVDFEGRHFTRRGVEVFPKPVHGSIPLLMGGHAPAAIDRVARLADAFIMDGGTDSDVFAERGHNRGILERVETGHRLYCEALERHGRGDEPVQFYLTLGGFLHEDGADAAWEAVRDGYMYTRRVYGDWYGLRPEEYEGWYPDRMSPDEHARRRGEMSLGTPDDVADLLGRLRDIVGDGLHVMFRSKYPGVDHDATMRSVSLLGEVRDRLA